jgi:ribosomal protein S18 acetylase RimI-like enzyme
MKRMIRRRIAERDDRVLVALIRSELLPHTKRTMPDVVLNRDILAKRLSGNTTYVLLGAGMRLIGFVSCLIRGKTLNIDMIAVDRKSQGRGHGSKLMKLAERYGVAQGCDRVILYVDQSNRSAQQFYLSKGYIVQEYIDAFQCLSMEKRL